MKQIRNKIDLHLHIDGSVHPQTVYELSRKYLIEPECHMSLEEITTSMVIQPGTFDPDFLTFNPPIRIMQYVEGIKRVTKELVEDLVLEDVKYAELRFAPQYHLEKGLTQREVVEAACSGLKEGLQEHSMFHAGIILCCMNVGDAMSNHDQNIETIELAKEFIEQGVCGIDVAGYENNMEDYADLFQLACRYGLHQTCHSEFTVKDTIGFHTSRIGHGYQFAQDDSYVQLALQSGVTLEMCPVSSVKYDYGLCIDETHPLRTLFLAGANVTVNTDNKTVLDTNLEKEYMCMRQMGFTDEEIEEVNRCAIYSSFASDTIKKELLALTD